MPLRKKKPVTSSLRHSLLPDFSEISKKSPEKSLTGGLKKNSGRNNLGRVTTRHKGGGHKRRYRFIDWKGRKAAAKVAGIEYDPNRTARLALLHYTDGKKAYVLAPAGLAAGSRVETGETAAIKTGNRLLLRNIPEGTGIYNLELQPGKGGQLARAAGCGAVLVAKGEKYGNVKLPSGEVRLISLECMASIGQVGYPEHKYVSLGKAGRKRWRGVKPTVRGIAMNPVDHPMGGGEGRGKGNISMSPWGKPSKGYKTKRPVKYSDKFRIQLRKGK